MDTKYIGAALFSVAFFFVSVSSYAQAPHAGRHEDMRVKVIVDNDLSGDPDGLFALVHQVLCPSVNIRGIIGAHLGKNMGFGSGDVNTAQAAADNAEEILEHLGKKGEIKVVAGAPEKMTSPHGPKDSEGARLIISEAMDATPERPLYVLCGGPLTDIASALLLKPEIAPNIILVWIGGQEYDFGHQKPWGGISEVEYNLNLSVDAARYIFNESDVRLWQVPRDVYRRCLYGFAELECNIKPEGRTGAYLAASLERFGSMMGGKEMYVLGDSPLVLLSSLQTFFEPDTASSDFKEIAAPGITPEGLYDFSVTGRTIRVYTDIDTGLMFRDMEAKIRLAAKKENCLNNSADN